MRRRVPPRAPVGVPAAPEGEESSEFPFDGKPRAKGMTEKRLSVGTANLIETQKVTKVWSIRENLEHEQAVEQMLTQGIADYRIGRIMKAKFNVGRCRTGNLLARVRARWVRDNEVGRPAAKAEAIHRLKDSIFEARKDRKWSAVANLESLVADMQGTREPTAIDVHLRAGDALTAIVANMTGETMKRMIATAQERARIAAQYEKGRLLPVAAALDAFNGDAEPEPIVHYRQRQNGTRQ